jgi:hypothetical protein
VGVEINLSLSTGHRKIMNLQIPKWADDFIDEIYPKLGLQIWQVKLVASKTPNLKNSNADACCYANSETYICEIHIRPKLLEVEHTQVKVLLIHELYHVAMSTHDRVVMDLLTGFVPRGDKRLMAVSLFRVQQEQMAVRMSYVLYELIRQAQESISVNVKENADTD